MHPQRILGSICLPSFALAVVLLGGTAAHGATPTAVVVTVNPGTGLACADVVLSAVVDPQVPGMVQFSSGGVEVGGAVPVDGTGYALLTTSALPAGDHAILAAFTPTDPAAYDASSQTSPTFRLDPCNAGPPDDQTITTDVPAGSLTLDTPYTETNPIRINKTALSPDATYFHGESDVSGIFVLDTRAGAQPWTLTALAGDLMSGVHVINSQNVGFVDVHETTHVGAGTFTGSDNPAAFPPVQPGAPGTLGIGRTPKVAATNTGPGSSEIAGRLTLTAPTSTNAGRYTGTFTLTVS